MIARALDRHANLFFFYRHALDSPIPIYLFIFLMLTRSQPTTRCVSVPTRYVILDITPAALAEKGMHLKGDLTLGENLGVRAINSTLPLYSKVVQFENTNTRNVVERPMPHCPRHIWAVPSRPGTRFVQHIFAKDAAGSALRDQDVPPTDPPTDASASGWWLEMTGLACAAYVVYRSRFARRQLRRLPQVI